MLKINFQTLKKIKKIEKNSDKFFLKNNSVIHLLNVRKNLKNRKFIYLFFNKNKILETKISFYFSKKNIFF